MAEVYLWAAAGGFALLGYGMAKRLGLLDDVPRDPKARVASYASGVLLVLKDQLIGSQVLAWDSGRVEYLHKGANCALWVESGALHCQQGPLKESFPVGDSGRLTFELVGEEMSVEILAAEAGGAEHTARVSVRVLAKSA